jgi:phospholipid/cholesterol/gamma-HCH transport system substrate-binding protein
VEGINMKKYSMETTVGIFVVIGLMLVGYMTVKLGKLDVLGGDYYTLDASFTSITGLRPGGSIQITGVEVGKVDMITLNQEDQVAVVTMKIKKGIVIYDDAIASIKTSGIIGDKYVSIDAGGSEDVLEPGGTITETESAVDIIDLVGKYAFGSVDEKKE